MGVVLSRRSSNEYIPPSKETIAELCADTGFTEQELLKLHENFYKDCPDGKLTFKQFQHEYSRIMGKPRKKTLDYIKHMFTVYDQDKNQIIDFREFVMALSVASVVNRVRLIETIFSIFDLDNDGQITKDEMGKMLNTLIDVTNSNKKDDFDNPNERNSNKPTNLQKSLDDAFHELNLNHDECITRSEFVEWYIASGFLTDIQSNELNTHQQNFPQESYEKSRHFLSQPWFANRNRKDKRIFSQPIYMSRMIERKPPVPIDEDDEHCFDNPVVHERTTTNENDLNPLKSNNRWKYLFESIMRRSRGDNDDVGQRHGNVNDGHRTDRLNTQKQEYNRDISIRRSSPPDIITTWF